MPSKRCFALLTGLMMTCMLHAQIDYKGFPQWSWHNQDSTEYYLYTPSNIQPGKKYPIALFMHGCCGEDYHATLRNAVDPPARMWHNFGANTQSIPTYIISPATSRGWKQHFVNLKKVMDDLIANHQGDPQRVYVCGFSMGGEGTFRIIQEYPDYFAAALPMGMSFRGDSVKVKDIPIWTNQGETDWWSRFLKKTVAAIRQLNGAATDTGATWVTGVNPRYTSFKGVDHGVQWIAASTQDLTGWAYQRVNDGNRYPNVFFESPSYKQVAQTGQSIDVKVNAADPDGSISRVELFINKKKSKTINGAAPYSFKVITQPGDNLLEAVAYDNKGKSSTATTIIRVPTPVKISSTALSTAFAGSAYSFRLQATGNGSILFSTNEKVKLPDGIVVYPDGQLKGMASSIGRYTFTVIARDEDGDETSRKLTLEVKARKPGTVLVTNVRTLNNKKYPVSPLALQETPNFNSKDTVLSTLVEEINFSNIGRYGGSTYIRTDVNDTSRTDIDFLKFDIDAPARIIIGYEVMDKSLHTTVPDWLKNYRKLTGEQIVAQYRYYDLYEKDFPKGTVIIPGADAIKNGVSTNYFVIIRGR